MKLKTISIAAFSAVPLLMIPNAQAHISYSGRNFGSFTGLSYETVTISNQAVTGNFGWADAADRNLGDSHKGRAFRFHLDNETALTLTVAANPSATATSVGGLIPAFSIYQGLAGVAPFATSQTALPSSPDHDEAAASVSWRTAFAQVNLGLGLDAAATGGSWNALGNWRIGGDGDLPGDFSQLSAFAYKGFAIDTDKNGSAELTTRLGPGDYTLFIGGNELANKDSADAALAYGLTATIAVGSVPEPSAVALGLAGAVLAATLRVRQHPSAGSKGKASVAL